ncbi:ABC transporter ATP-binding protein [Caldibacillus lycopersici]|uniref:ABC transporter ATP-binding protein n=1 Tax=Perspicuibacillus lycopersici TaxID=1325689 RepID=A0AAE3ISM8_9BACI|nr:ABC transporter ATP-binding protein [Perspicuibacillus lycopersici]MCU9613865.1 ABC transporter ATP-binding protein [Perspicuibacillus lycopersici]
MANSALEVQALSKRIGNKLIVDGVSFQIQKGEIFGLLGPNGAGKTTIIRMIVSLINRTGGKVFIDGTDIDSNFSEAMNKLGAIVENPEFYKYMTGYQNLKHYARMSLSPISQERIDEIVKLVDLENAIHQKVKTYSLGMRQRLGVAQALLHNPSIIILDEPTNGLDPQGIREFRQHLRTLADQGIAVLISSHLLSEIELMCDRYVIIEKGKLIHSASIHEGNDVEQEQLREVIFTVNSSETAIKLLKNLSISNVVKKSEQSIMLMLPYEEIAKINAHLVKNEIAISEITVTRKTLEDRFIEITNQQEEMAVK